MQAREDIQAALGMYAANIGKQSNAVTAKEMANPGRSSAATR